MTQPTMAHLILGIDPGLSGAFAVYDPRAKTFLAIADFPKTQHSKKDVIDGAELASTFSLYAKDIRFAVIEEVGVMSGKEGRVGMFRFGHATGIVHGVLGSLRIPSVLVKPAVWKSLMGVTSDKESSRQKILNLFPRQAEFFHLKKYDGRAEAALLAVFGSERFIHKSI